MNLFPWNMGMGIARKFSLVNWNLSPMIKAQTNNYLTSFEAIWGIVWWPGW